MVKVKIVYDRDKCIGTITCEHLNPELWNMNTTDAKADLKGAKKEGDKWVLETEMTFELQMACEQCPASVIEVFDKETGKKLF